MPYHVALDRAPEARLGGAKLGTTRRGIGPAYADRAWRAGFGWATCSTAPSCAPGSRASCRRRTPAATSTGADAFDLDALVDQALAWGERLAAAHRRHDGARPGRRWRAATRPPRGRPGNAARPRPRHVPVRDEPNPVAGGACTGGGVGPLQIDQVIGVIKAYSTRVGSGPFPTELDDETGPLPPRRATSSGRRPAGRAASAGSTRCRCATRSPSTAPAAIMLNKLDILSGLPDPAVRRVRDRRPARRPGRPSTTCRRRRPIYEDLPGLGRADRRLRSLGDLPDARAATSAPLEDLAGVPIMLVWVGPERPRRSSGPGADRRRAVAV